MSIHVICCVSDERVYGENLGKCSGREDYFGRPARQALKGWTEVRDTTNVNRAYNEVMRSVPTTADYWCFVHEDVWLPPEWLTEVNFSLSTVGRRWYEHAVCGIAGMTGDGEKVGYLLNRGEEWGEKLKEPTMVRLVDECCFFLKTQLPNGPMWFNERAPNHHLAATDISLRSGLPAYAVRGFCHHNRRVPVEQLDTGYLMSCGFYRGQWDDRLFPVKTTCSTLELNPHGMLRVYI